MAPAAAAGGAAAGRRTCVPKRRSPAGTPTAATPNSPWCRRPSPTAYPDGLDDIAAAPLLCAGIVGYRALRRAELPPGGRLGIYGFGASAHLVAQVAIAQGATVHVLTRAAEARRLALDLGAASAGPADAAPPEPLDAAVLFAPAGELVPIAMRALDQGGTLAVAGIHLSDIPSISLRRRAVPREAAPQRHRQHPGRRRGVPSAGCPAAHPADDDAAPLGRSRSGAGRPGRRPDHRRRRARSLTAQARRGRHSRARGRHGRPRERPRRPLR